MKVLTTGNWFVVIVLISVSLAATTKLEIRNNDGDLIDQVAVGQPFMLHAKIDQVGGSIQYPQIKGLDNFTVHRAGFQLNTINGHATAFYSYQVRIDQPGSYELGPVEVQGHEESNVVNVTVSDKPAVAQKGSREFLELYVNKNKLFVGEKVSCSLRFYYTDRKMAVQTLGMPNQVQANQITLGEPQGPIQGTDKINGIPYHYLEWQWDAYPQQVGTLMLPAYYVDYMPASHAQQGHQFAAVLSFFNKQAQQKRTYSNAATLKVMPLPEPSKGKVPVGTVSRFSARIHPSVAKQGEGMVLQLAVTGDIDMNKVDIPVLHAMPAAFKWYESKKYIEGDTKYIEFIVQGLELGDWLIPQQQLTYFDVTDELYKTMETNQLRVTITPSKAGNASALSPQTKVDVEQEQEESLPLDPSGQWYAASERAVPWWWFVVVMTGAALMWFFFLMKQYRNRGDTIVRKKKRAFVTARSQLKQAEKKGDSTVLYQIFMNLFADRFGISIAELSQEKIKQRMHDFGFSEKLCHDWEAFFIHIQEYSFFKTGVHDTVIFILAQKWLDELEKKI